MKLSVIIPVFNEAATVARVIREVREKNRGRELELILVDDGSSDETLEEIRSVGDREIKLLRHERNIGKGAAIRTGLEAVTGEAVIIQDADLEYDPGDYAKLLAEYEAGAPVVYGVRTLEPGQVIGHRLFYYGGYLVTLLTRWLYWCDLHDEPTCYKLFKTDVLKSIPLKCKRFEFCPEVTAKLIKRGIRIAEAPIRYRPRRMHEGKKIRWRDGVEAVWTLFKYRVLD